jgi:predicted nucleic acid-binding protein
MAKTDTLLDAGPLVAYFNRRDEHHAWAREQMSQLDPPLHTCEAVLSEAFHLLEPTDQGTRSLLTFLDRGAVTASFSYAEHADRIHALMRTYADQPMSYADACLVRMAEVRRERTIVTTDDDFHVYRTAGEELLDVWLPAG